MPIVADHVLLDEYARSRSADAFAELARRHAAMVFATARRITRNDHDAHDVSQECFLELSRRAQAIKSPVAAWLHRVASTRALNTVRNRTNRRRYESRPRQPDSPSDQLTWAELEPFIDQALNELPDDVREALIMHYLQGRSQAEVADAQGVNQSTISRRLATGVEMLRKLLESRGGMISTATLAALLLQADAHAAPAALVASLGKMALAGPAPIAAVPSVSSIASIAAAAAIVLAVGAAAWLLLRDQGQTMTPVTASSSTAKIIDNVPTLGWGRNEETTYCGALSAALQAACPQRDYVTLMGDSALAFRTRWWRASQGAGWCPSSPGGEFRPWSDLAFDSVGWQTRAIVRLDEPGLDMSQHKAEVVAAIDAGRPILAYSDNMDMSVIYGYESAGELVHVRDYFKGDAQTVLPLKNNKGMLVFLTEKSDPPSRHDAIVRGLRQAVTDFDGWSEDRRGSGGAGAYHVGKKAYEVWINDLKSAGTLAPEDRRKMFHPSWWSFDILHDARIAAANYLRASAGEFPGDAGNALLAAADAYDRCTAVTGSAFSRKDAFLGSWSGKSFDDWTDEVRQREADILAKVRDLDAEAIAFIQKALVMIEPNSPR